MCMLLEPKLNSLFIIIWLHSPKVHTRKNLWELLILHILCVAFRTKFPFSHSIYIRTVRSLSLFCFGTFNSFLAGLCRNLSVQSQTTDTQWRIKSKISENLGRCGRQTMLRPYLQIWEWELIFGRAVKAISSLGVRSPWQVLSIWYTCTTPL